MNNTLGRRFTLWSLLAFALPNMIMMLFLSLYTIVDGAFVSRFAGTIALSAVNMVYPTIGLQLGVAIMIAAGGSAIIARKMGEGDGPGARESFSFLVLVELVVGLAIAAAGLLFLDDIVRLMGATPAQFELCRVYGGICFAFAPLLCLQTAFQTFFVTAGRPGLGLAVTLAAGVTNIALDYVFIVPLNMGVAGAALATGLGYSVAALAGLLYFWLGRDKSLFFVRPRLSGRVLLHACANGSSEMVTNLANAVTTLLFNITFLRYFGEDGVASITIILYFQFVFSALYFGYANGIAPVVSYNYGSGNTEQLKSLMKSSVIFIALCSLATYVVSQLSIGGVLTIFTPADSRVYQLTLGGFRIFAASFLFMGLGIFASAWFTALLNGRVSAIISFARTFVFIVGAIFTLPYLWGELGVWLAVPLAEALGVMVSVFFLVKYKRKYQY